MEAKRALHDFQTAEVLGMSLREQLAAREAELRELGGRHSALQTEQASWGRGAGSNWVGQRAAAVQHTEGKFVIWFCRICCPVCRH